MEREKSNIRDRELSMDKIKITSSLPGMYLLYAGHFPLWAKIIFYPIGVFAFIIVLGAPIVQFVRRVRVNRKLRRRK
jgi:hypothetical protein